MRFETENLIARDLRFGLKYTDNAVWSGSVRKQQSVYKVGQNQNSETIILQRLHNASGQVWKAEESGHNAK